ncbi:MAG TPA: glycosyltransferase [Pyrinomonadaceae bacterium]|nr:glycosyltransferase [Pyrinomonadaceae bacterium]
MRIVLASFSSLPNSIGGGEVHLYELAQALKRGGHQPSILTVKSVCGDKVEVTEKEFNGLVIHQLTVPPCISIYDRDPKLTAWATAWLAEQKADVLHLFLFNQLLGLIPAANQLGIPVCMTGLEFSYFCRRYDLMHRGHQRCALDQRGSTCEQCVLSSYSQNQRLIAGIARLLPANAESGARRFVARTFGDLLPGLGQRGITRQIEQQRANFNREIAAVITPSSVMKDFYLAQGADPAKLHFVPYGTNVRPIENEHVTRNGHLRVGYIGRLDPKKGVDVLCEALRKLPPHLPVQVKIFGPVDNGSASYASRLQGHADADSRIKLMGKLDRDRVADAYNEIDVLVVPSIWYENSPITISESLSHKCPVVCSDTAGMTDLIQHEVNGLTFATGESNALSDCLRRLVDEPELLPRLRRSVKPVETTQEISRRIVKVYEDVRRQSV